MNNLSDIKRRLASVKQTRQITGAMETISVAKMRKALEAFDKNHVYFDVLYGVTEQIVNSGDAEVNSIIAPPAVGKDLVVVVASDKGLCGAFNHDIFRAADSVIDGDSVVMPIGQMALEHYSKAENIDKRFTTEAYSPDYSRAKKIAEAVLESYGNGIKSAKIVYTRMKTHAVWAPQVLSLLPIESENIGGDEKHTQSTTQGAEFVPSPSAVLEKLLPIYLSGLIYGALVHSAAAEHSARRAAMSASTKNADEMTETLSIDYNRARQSAVTEQITEIIGSTQALGQGG